MGCWLLIAHLASACDARGAGDYIEIPPLLPAIGPRQDAGVEVPDGAMRCEVDSQCDDGVDCTDDVCISGTYCRFQPVPSRCSDGLYCTGFERCDPKLGCQMASPESCADLSACTVDRCDDALKACVHEPRDFDHDGEADWHCSGGTDCDDFDPAVSSQTAEACGDGVDNDCDEVIDEANCGRPSHDLCSDALDISAGGTFSIKVAGAAADYDVVCEVASSADVVVVFELDTAADVSLTAQGHDSSGANVEATLAVRASCSTSNKDIECVRGYPSHVRMRALPAGRYFAIIHTPADKEVVVTAAFGQATPAPTNVNCATAQPLDDGGRISGDLIDVSDDFLAPCGLQPEVGEVTGVQQADLVYRVTTTEVRDLVISGVTPANDPLVLSVRSMCEDPASTLLCARGSPASLRLRELQAGTYFVIVESPSYLEADFDLDVRLVAPTPELEGDSCAGAVPLALNGSTVLGSLVDKQSRVATSCDQFTPDTVYSLTLSEPSDLVVTTTAGGAPLAVALQEQCGKPSSDLACYLGQGGKRRFRNLAAGDYALVLEAYDAREVAVAAKRLPVTMPIATANNETCDNAFEVPAAGGVFAGDTSSARNDYVGCANSTSADVVFRLKLKDAAQVRVITEAEFDTVLYRFDAEGMGAAACEGTFTSCNDDGPSAMAGESELDEMLAAGVYYYVVDGFSVGSAGAFYVIFDVM